MNNKEIVLEFFEVFFKDSKKLKNFCHPDVRLHWRKGLLADGLEALIKFGNAHNVCFPDMVFDIQDILVEGNKVAVRLIQSGTLKAEWGGFTNFGAKFTDVAECMFFTLEDGLIIDIWPLLDIDDKVNQIKSDQT